MSSWSSILIAVFDYLLMELKLRRTQPSDLNCSLVGGIHPKMIKSAAAVLSSLCSSLDTPNL